MKQVTKQNLTKAASWALWAAVLGQMVYDRNWNVVAIFLLSFILIHMFIVRKP